MFFASSVPPSAQDVLQPCGRLGRFGNNPPARLQRVEEGLASGQRATLHFALQRQRLPAVGGCDETEFVAFTDELSCERVERQLAVRAARNCAKVGIRQRPGSVRSMPCRKRRTQPAAISAWRIRCSATGLSSSSSLGPFVSHVELFWTMPEFKAFFEQLATFCRVLLFDKAGVGLVGPRPASSHAG